MAAMDKKRPHANDVIRHGRQGAVMRDNDHRFLHGAAQRLQQFQNRLAGLVVQCAGRLVAEQELGVFGNRPGDGHPLLFPAGKLRREIVHPFRQADRLQRFGGIHRRTAQFRRQLHVFQRRQVLHQVVKLENKPHFVPPVLRELPVILRTQHRLPDADFTGITRIHAAQQVQQRRFPGAARPDNHAELAGLHGK